MTVAVERIGQKVEGGKVSQLVKRARCDARDLLGMEDNEEIAFTSTSRLHQVHLIVTIVSCQCLS